MSGLTKKQIEALRSISVDTSAVLSSEEAMNGLNEEIMDMVNTYATEQDANEAKSRLGKPMLPEATPSKPKTSEVAKNEVKRTPRVIGKKQNMPARTNIEVEKSMEDIESELDRQIEEARRQKRELAEKQAVVAAAAAAAAKPVVEEEQEEEQSFKSQIEEMLSKIEGAPTKAQIAAWKKNGTLHATAFSETDIFLFTYLKRSQWTKIKEIVETKTETISGTDGQRELKEKVVKSCVLWPNIRSDEFTYSAPAGLVDTLFDLIMLHSYFLSTQQAMQLTTTL